MHPEKLQPSWNERNPEVKAVLAPSPQPRTSGNAFSFYPRESAEALRDAIRGAAQFHGLSEVSHFASAAVDLLAVQEQEIICLTDDVAAYRSRILALEAQNYAAEAAIENLSRRLDKLEECE